MTATMGIQKELFLSNLPETLEALCDSQSALQDDTILHRLLDLIKEFGTVFFSCINIPSSLRNRCLCVLIFIYSMSFDSKHILSFPLTFTK